MHRLRGAVRLAAVVGGLGGLIAATSPPAWAQTANLGLVVTDAPDPVALGTLLTYTLTVSNGGPGIANNASLITVIPTGTTFVSASAPAGWTLVTPPFGATGTMTAARATLPTGGPSVFSLVVRVVGGTGSVVNVSSVASSTPDPALGNNGVTTTTAVKGVADLSVTVTGPALGAAGSNIVDTITLRNNGPDNAHDVTLVVPVPFGTVPSSFAEQSGPTFSLSFDGMRTFRAAATTFPAGATASFLVSYTLAGGAATGTVLGTAVGVLSSFDPNPANNSMGRRLGVPLVVTGAGPGDGPLVRGFTPTGAATSTSFLAYAPGFTGGVFVATGSVDDSGLANLVTGAGPGGGPHVRVFRVDNSDTGISFLAYGGFTGGVRVATGDIDGDGRDEIVTAPGAGGGPHIKVWKLDGTSPTLAAEFFAYHPTFTGGVFVAAGDVDGDGRAEIVTGAGSGGAPHARIWKVTGSVVTELASFFAYPTAFTGGVRVAVADLTQDGRADIVTAPGPGGGPHVKVFNGTTLAQVGSFFAYDPGFTGGVFVAASPLAGAGNYIVTGAGAGGGPHVKVLDLTTLGTIASFLALDPTFTGGVPVAIGP